MTRCERCAGCIIRNYDEPYCANCGWRDNPLFDGPQEERGSKHDGKKTGPQLPDGSCAYRVDNALHKEDVCN